VAPAVGQPRQEGVDLLQRPTRPPLAGRGAVKKAILKVAV